VQSPRQTGLQYENGKMRTVETILSRGKGGIKENDRGGEFS
jgi:hypothetical protein